MRGLNYHVIQKLVDSQKQSDDEPKSSKLTVGITIVRLVTGHSSYFMLSRFDLQVQEFKVIMMSYESFGVTKNSNVPPLKTSPLPQTCTVSLDFSLYILLK